ncbi:LAFA_0D14400g1_1 [Lachancea sp. 'fantastica']|nr:LAFA_0D14400g1_1 [Lachancea sp. 'fantastica']
MFLNGRLTPKLAVLLCLIGLILESIFIKHITGLADRRILSNIYNSRIRSQSMLSIQKDKNHEVDCRDDGYVAGVYYSNWSPYPPRNHFPHDIDFRQISHVFYSFFVVDPHSGQCTTSDEYSDTQLDVFKQMEHTFHKLNLGNSSKGHLNDSTSRNSLPMGCLGELFYLKYTDFLIAKGGPSGVNNFKTIMSVGGWSNREAFKALVADSAKLQTFVDTCVENMFKFGFDGIDIDWEFPENDSREPAVFLDLLKALRTKLIDLENAIFGSDDSHQHFLLTAAISADPSILEYLPLSQANSYLDYFNLMAYDFSGSWSEQTAYQSNLYNSQGSLHPRDGLTTSTGLSADKTIQMLTLQCKVPASKIVLGMPAYGRGFKKVSYRDRSSTLAVNRTFHGVQGTSKGEEGISLYKSLPGKGNQELFDDNAVSAFCINSKPFKKSTDLTVYDNPASMQKKAQYVKQNKLAGGFWWESCGENYADPERSLTLRFIQELKSIKKTEPTIYKAPQVAHYYNLHFKEEFLSSILQK